MASVSIVVTTRNRCAEVCVAVESALSQDADCEVIVFDDASEDGTASALAQRFPGVRVETAPERAGYIRHRNLGFERASGDYVLSLDDDAYFSEPDIVARAVAAMEAAPGIGAVAIPYIEPLNKQSLSSQRSPFAAEPRRQLRSYVGCAHLVRRDVALALGRYRAFFVHQGEERDLCLRMLEAGWKVVYGDSAPIVHLVSPKRENDRVTFYAARNQILFDILNLPLPYLIVYAVWHPVALLKYRFSRAKLPLRLRALASGFAEGARRWRERKAVSMKTYRLWRSLPSHGPLPWKGAVPPPCVAREVETPP